MDYSVPMDIMYGYLKNVLGYAGSHKVSTYELVSEALEKDGMQRPENISFREWAFIHQDHIRARSGITSNSKYLVNTFGNKAHIWKGEDTACGMYSRGEMSKKGKFLRGTTNGRGVCIFCKQAEFERQHELPGV